MGEGPAPEDYLAIPKHSRSLIPLRFCPRCVLAHEHSPPCCLGKFFSSALSQMCLFTLTRDVPRGWELRLPGQTTWVYSQPYPQPA